MVAGSGTQSSDDSSYHGTYSGSGGCQYYSRNYHRQGSGKHSSCSNGTGVNTSRGNSYYNWITSLRSKQSNEFKQKRKEEQGEDLSTSALVNKIDRVHWYIEGNARKHNTIKYDLVHNKEQKPVLRRGQDFYLALRFRDKDFDIKRDRVVLYFRFGPRPSVQKGTMAVIGVNHEEFTKSKDDWDARIDSGSNGKDLVLQVYVPPSVPVGIWRLDIVSSLHGHHSHDAMHLYEDDTDVFILFNPWCTDDLVFMENDMKREEYVLNDHGKVFVGSYRCPQGRPWAFGQFDTVVLPVAAYILQLANIADTERGNPVNVVRAISTMVHNSSKGGVMEGRWDGKYKDGYAPCKWTGTVRILKEYLSNGYRPVKYGQCWVFSAIVTTICRALGIPCRSVTNFVSAHDASSSLSIDKFFDYDGREVEGGPDGEQQDLVWSFHVWNDVWMFRPDIPATGFGWQAIDATPQQLTTSNTRKSDWNSIDQDNNHCGPIPLECIKKGNISLGYDGPLMYSKVNADIIHWGADLNSDWGWKRMKMNKYHIGRAIVTKLPGKDDDTSDTDKEDISNQYKYYEGSETERHVVQDSICGHRRGRQYHDFMSDIQEDVLFVLKDISRIEVGDSFQVKVIARNEGNEHRTVTTMLSAHSAYYTGIKHSQLKKTEGKFQLGPKQQQDVSLIVPWTEYWKKLVEGWQIKLNVVCSVLETGQTYTEEEDFIVEKPRLEIKIQNEVLVQQPCQVTFTFKNPLEVPLTVCHMSVDGAGLMHPKSLYIDGEVPANSQFSHSIKFKPLIHGERKIIASFSSNELSDIYGGKSLMVKKS